MADPFNRSLVTAGNPYAGADGLTLGTVDQNAATQYWSAYGPQDAPIVFAQFRNKDLLSSGAAIMTPYGVMSTATALAQLGNAGYTGPKDPASVGQAVQTYKLFGNSGPSLGMMQNCASCATGKNDGSCSGCAPSTPPGYVTLGSGTPTSTTSGLPFGFKPGAPVGVGGFTLPLWVWGAAAAGLWLKFRSGGHRH